MTDLQPDARVLDAEHAAFIQRGVSMSVASCSSARLPSLSRAFGCKVSSDRRSVTVFVVVPRSQALLRDLQAGAGLAAVFSLPSTHETLQLKGARAQVVAPVSPDSPVAATLARLFDETLQGLDRHCHIRHSMLLMHDQAGDRLYTVATRGYPESGVGSEVRVGEGIIGVAARERTPIRIGYAAQEYLYGRALRECFADSADGDALETEIPVPGLADSGSQLAVPLTFNQRLLGVLYAESPQEQRFTYEDEDALVVLAGHLALAMELLSQAAEQHDDGSAAASSQSVQGTPVTVRYFAADHSLFIANDYLIMGVAGAVIWKLLRDYVEAGRCEFTNRELRLDLGPRLPGISDNLEARLILLQRRLAERCSFLAIEKTGRGRVRLHVLRPLQLSEVPAH